jgi:hypothetical protein
MTPCAPKKTATMNASAAKSAKKEAPKKKTAAKPKKK